MSEHPYRDPTPPSAAKRERAQAWAVALVLLWIASVARTIALFFDHSLAGPLTGLSIALAVGIPMIAVNARVLSED
jgi:hypothetical protein